MIRVLSYLTFYKLEKGNKNFGELFGEYKFTILLVSYFIDATRTRVRLYIFAYRKESKSSVF